MEEKKELVFLSYTEIQLLIETLNDLAARLCPPTQKVERVEDCQKIASIFMLMGKLEGYKDNIENS